MNSPQEFKCVFCNEIFAEQEDLKIHFRKHADPNFNQKRYKGRSQDAADTSVEKPKNQVEVVECDVCPEVFSSISKAITHKHKMHPDHDTKYFCPWCGKLFTMKHLYKKHMNAAHMDKKQSEERLFHCDSCEVEFYLPAAMLYHNKFYHRQDDLPILGHSKKLKMILEDVIQIYYCPFCGEEHENKVNLHKHISEDHNGENQSPDDVFRCPLCDAIFFYLDAYELHLTYHSIEDLYTERNAMMDEITDFSLETVQPLQEKVENAEPNNAGAPATMGIEDLLELTMNDPDTNRKSKKHKKHKKSKKPAITLDEFLNMNQDVFGEGLDFQGVEEVPTQVIAKRFKTKKVVPTSKLVSSDLAKLKRHGIVIKKQSNKMGKHLVETNVALKSAANIEKTSSPILQTKSSFAANDPVLQKLLTQGSQIKIVKKSNQDSREQGQYKQYDKGEEKLELKNVEEQNDNCNPATDVNKTEQKLVDSSKENSSTENPNMNSVNNKLTVDSPNPESPSIINENIDIQSLQNNNEDSNHSSTSNKDMPEKLNLPDTTTKSNNNVSIFQNNSNITMKLAKQNSFTPANVNNQMGQEANNTATALHKAEVNDEELQENKEANSSSPVSGNSSINALKHLSHLITIKSVNSSKAIPLPYHKSDYNLQEAETAKTSPGSENDSSKLTEVNQFCNFKNLDGITIKPTNKSIPHTSTNEHLAVLKDSLDEHNGTDDVWHEDTINENEMDLDKLTPIGRAHQLNVETKHSPKTFQKESPKGGLNIDNNSQSSVDLLKHLKNVTAKPVTTNSHKVANSQYSPNAVKKVTTAKTSVQKEVSEDGTEIFSIDDSDSDEGHCTSSSVTENKTQIKNMKSFTQNNNITMKSTAQQRQETIKNVVESNEMDKESDSDETFDRNRSKPSVSDMKPKFSSPKPNQKTLAINNVLKNLSRNITVKSRNSSPSQSARSQDQNSRDSLVDPNDADSDSDTPLSKVKITEIDNTSDDEMPEQAESERNVKVEHPDDSHSDHDNDEELNDNMSDFEEQIAASTLQKQKSIPSPKLNKLNNQLQNADLSSKPTDNASCDNNEHEKLPTDDIPEFAKNLSNQISIKQIKKSESKNANVAEQSARSINQCSVSQKMATASNQVNSFNKEVKTVKTFQTQTKTVIQEITTTVTKTIKTVNQSTKQEVRNVAQSSSFPTITQKVQGMNQNFGQKNLQGVKVRQSVPTARPKVRGQAPQNTRPAICAPPQVTRPAICAPVRSNQLVPVRHALNRPSGPRPRMPTVVNIRPSTSGQQRPIRPVKVTPRVVPAPSKKPVETPGHFSCFKKPKESLIPEPDFSMINKSEEDAQFSSTMQMSKSNFSSSSKIVKGNSMVTSTQMKSEMSANSQQLSKLRGMSGLVVKTSQSQAKQTHIEEKSEMNASKRNALEAIQKLQSQGLLVKKPRLDVSEDNDNSQHGSDDTGHFSNEEFDE